MISRLLLHRYACDARIRTATSFPGPLPWPPSSRSKGPGNEAGTYRTVINVSRTKLK